MHIRRYDSGGCATNYVDFGIYSANIQVNEKEESQEQATGIYIKKASMVQAKIGPSMLEMGSPEFVEMAEPQQINFKIEAIEGSSKISLWEYDPSTGSYTSRSFPYTYSCTPDPASPFLSKTLYLKGEDTSSQVGDIKLTLKGYKISEDDSIAIDTVVITVFNIDVDWDPSYGLSEDAEKETGLYIPLNDDDDNSDTVLDKGQHPVYKENDLKKLIIRQPLPSNLPGHIYLTILSGSDKIKLWEDTFIDTQKIVEVTSRSYNISDELQSDTWLWTEGYSISSPKEIEIKISYTTPDETITEDRVKATIIIGSVLIDPGHGGTDPGAIGPTGLKEKEVNLDIGLRLKNLLENAGVRVGMTRESDVYVSLNERHQKTKDFYKEPNGENTIYLPIFFFSIHCNSYTDSSVKGTETYTPEDYFLLENIFAHQIQNRVHNVVLEDNRGVKRKNWQVLRHDLNGNTDGNLNEVTFISNPISEDRLKNDDFKQAVAEVMKKAILKVLVEDVNYPKQPNP